MSNAAEAADAKPVLKSAATYTVALIGNPNTGKTTLFNALTGLKQHVGNYPGVTVEQKIGSLQLDADTRIDLIDLPGTYSLAARSPDEMIAVDVLLGQQQGAQKVDAILAIADASNPERNFYLISQLCELNLPVIVAMNMMDVATTKGLELDISRISTSLGTPVVAICANKGKGLPELRTVLKEALVLRKSPVGPMPKFPDAMSDEVSSLMAELHNQAQNIHREINRLEAFRILVDKGGYAEQRLEKILGGEFKQELEARRQRASKNPLPAEEVRVRYGWVRQVLGDAVKRPTQPPATHSDAIDKVATHWASGTLIFGLLMLVVFQSIFQWAHPLMDLIQGLFDSFGAFVGGAMPDGALKSLVCDGIIKGVGGVLVFLPQICLLFMFIAILEDCGYMSRAAFLMDRLFSRVGLSGKSFIPMLSSFACAVPGVMATRTIENTRDRLATILLAPLMSCSARLPVYLIMIGAFIPETKYFGWLSLHGLTLFAMYSIGIVVAIPLAWLFKKTLLRGETPPFLIELPSYKIPDLRSVLMRVYDRGKAFVVRAGTIILSVSVVVWALAYFPHSESIAQDFEQKQNSLEKAYKNGLKEKVPAALSLSLNDKKSALSLIIAQLKNCDDQKVKALEESGAVEDSPEAKEIEAVYQKSLAEIERIDSQIYSIAQEVRKLDVELADGKAALEKEESGAYLRESYFGRMGHAVEPLFKPLGWDWRISMAAIASFPAREVIVATLGQIFNIGNDANEESESLRSALRDATWDHGEHKLFNIPVALSIMIFFALCSQCAATLATIKRETNSWRWPIFSFSYMTVLAYFGAMLAYQFTMYLGWGNA
jgi:ferrous iron transport protein B